MATTGRMMYQSKGTFGGTRQAFYTPFQKNAVELVGGVMLDPTCAPPVGDKVFAGELGYYTPTSNKAKHLKTFVLAADLADDDTTVYFYADDFSHNPNGLTLMLAPATAATLGASVVITATKDVLVGVPVYKATIVADSLGEASKGDIFVEAKAVSAAAAEVLIPSVNIMFGSDIDILMPLSTSQNDYDKADYTVNAYLENVVYLDSVVIPPYILAGNKYNSTELFKL